MMPLHRDALSAWTDLVARGGVEPAERDADLVAMLRAKLGPGDRCLEETLARVSLADLLHAVFDAVVPFVEMLRDLLAYFERADAEEGPASWVLAPGESIAELEKHFERTVEVFRKLESTVEVPVVAAGDYWRVIEPLRAHNIISLAMSSALPGDRADPTAPLLQAWLAEYREGRFSALPFDLMTFASFPRIALLANIAMVWDTITELWGRERSGRRRGRTAGDEVDRDDLYAPSTVSFLESDYLVGQLIAGLGAAAVLTPPELQQLDDSLAPVESLPRVMKAVRIDIRDVERILKLPIWRRRHELYAAWIATELLRALVGHEIEYHTEGGTLPFAFREFRLATITSAARPLALLAEKRSPLIGRARGKGRKKNVQPDYVLWEGPPTGGASRVVIECKHYKRAATTSFAAALDDYARSHERAEVHLVNYGPVGDVLPLVSAQLRARCHAFGHLTPHAKGLRDELRRRIRAQVGEPVVRWSRPRGPEVTSAASSLAARVLAVDVSGSMRAVLGTLWIRSRARQLASAYSLGTVAAADVTVLGTWTASDEGLEAALACQGGGTSLAAPISALLGTHDEVVLVTDPEGLRDIDGVGVEDLTEAVDRQNGICVLRIRPPAAP